MHSDPALETVRPVSAPWALLGLGWLRDHDPGGPVVAGSFPAADFAIDACAEQACGRRRAQKQVIDAQAGISHPGISEVIPEGVDAIIWMQFTQRVGPAH